MSLKPDLIHSKSLPSTALGLSHGWRMNTSWVMASLVTLWVESTGSSWPASGIRGGACSMFIQGGASQSLGPYMRIGMPGQIRPHQRLAGIMLPVQGSIQQNRTGEARAQDFTAGQNTSLWLQSVVLSWEDRRT